MAETTAPISAAEIDEDIAAVIAEFSGRPEAVPMAAVRAAFERLVADRPEGDELDLADLVDALSEAGISVAAASATGEFSTVINAFVAQSAAAPVPISEIDKAYERISAAATDRGDTPPSIERFIGEIAAAGVRIDDEEEDGDVAADAPTLDPSRAVAGDGSSTDAYSMWRREVANHRVLSREEETEITHRYALHRETRESILAQAARLDAEAVALTTPGGMLSERERAIVELLKADPVSAAAAEKDKALQELLRRSTETANDPDRLAVILTERASIDAEVAEAGRAMRETEDAFLRCNYKLVLKHARVFWETTRRRADIMDLVQQGNSGMVEAFRRFDPTRGFKFSTFATFHIKQKISEWARERGSSIRVPTFRQREWARLRAYQTEFNQLHGRLPSDIELAEHFGKTVKKIAEIFAAETINSPASIDNPVSEEDGSATLGDLVQDRNAVSPEDQIVRIAVSGQIAEAIIRCLTPRERRVIQSRFGLYTGTRETLEEIGRRMRITRERVRQIEARAIEKLKRDKVMSGLQGSRAGVPGMPWASFEDDDEDAA